MRMESILSEIEEQLGCDRYAAVQSAQRVRRRFAKDLVTRGVEIRDVGRLTVEFTSEGIPVYRLQTPEKTEVFDRQNERSTFIPDDSLNALLTRWHRYVHRRAKQDIPTDF